MKTREQVKLTRRDLLRLSVLTGGAALIGSRVYAQTCPVEPPQPHDIDIFTGIGVGGEAFPTSPLILEPFTQELPVPKTMAPVANPAAMRVRKKNGAFGDFLQPPGPGTGDQ